MTDGGSGFAAAVAAGVALHEGAEMRVPRVLPGSSGQTTTRPKLQAGIELYGLAKLLHTEHPRAGRMAARAPRAVVRFGPISLSSAAWVDGRSVYTHELHGGRAVGPGAARQRRHLLFTYLVCSPAWPRRKATNK